MKLNRVFRYATFLMVLLLLISSLCSCFDIDELIVDLGLYKENKHVNEKYKVHFRESEGVFCEEAEVVKTIPRGGPVIFKLRINNNYVYMGNSAGADYDEATGTIRVDAVYAPMTIDVYAAFKYDIYCIEFDIPDTCRIEFIEGKQYSETAESVTVKIIYPQEYRFDGWEVSGAESEYNAADQSLETFSITPKEKGVVKLRPKFESAS